MEKVEDQIKIASKESKKSLKEILKETIESLDTPSTKALIKIIVTPHFFLKLILFLFLIGTSGYSSYLVIQSIINYFNYDVTTTSRTIYEMPTLFPKVTFCNVNSYTTQYAYDLLQIKTIDDSILSIEEEKRLGHDWNDILILCTFNSNQCDSSDFIWSYDEYYGNCFTFNSGLKSNESLIEESSIFGPFYGLSLILYVNFYEKLLNSTYKYGQVINNMGAVIRIGNSSYETYYSYGDGILLPPGFQTNIVLDREFKSILPKPYSNCEIDSSNSPQFIQDLDLYNLISQSDYEYTQQLCFVQCYQSFVISKYNCSSIWYPSLFNASRCSLNFSDYIWSIGDGFVVTFINKHCLTSCPLECDQIFYTTSLSSVLLNGYSYIGYIQSKQNLKYDFINRTLDLTTAKDSFVQVNIYYDSLSYTLTTESPQMDAISLFGSIGGNLGLFLGMSVFSICELIEVTVQIYFILKQRKNNSLKPI